jgi:hypothetical protein
MRPDTKGLKNRIYRSNIRKQEAHGIPFGDFLLISRFFRRLSLTTGGRSAILSKIEKFFLPTPCTERGQQ